MTQHLAVGWSDLQFFSIFENEHIATDQVNFYEFQSKNQQIFPCARGAQTSKFLFSKNHEDLINEYCLGEIYIYLLFTSINNRKKEN